MRRFEAHPSFSKPPGSSAPGALNDAQQQQVRDALPDLSHWSSDVFHRFCVYLHQHSTNTSDSSAVRSAYKSFTMPQPSQPPPQPPAEARAAEEAILASQFAQLLPQTDASTADGRPGDVVFTPHHQLADQLQSLANSFLVELPPDATPAEINARRDASPGFANLAPFFDHKSNLGRNLLTKAIKLGQQDAVIRFCKSRPDLINHTDGLGETPLTTAVEEGKRDCVEALLEIGAEVNRANARGLTPLCVAAANGDSAMAVFLLRNGASALLPAEHPPLALASAMHPEHELLVMALLEAAKSQIGPLCESATDEAGRIAGGSLTIESGKHLKALGPAGFVSALRGFGEVSEADIQKLAPGAQKFAREAKKLALEAKESLDGFVDTFSGVLALAVEPAANPSSGASNDAAVAGLILLALGLEFSPATLGSVFKGQSSALRAVVDCGDIVHLKSALPLLDAAKELDQESIAILLERAPRAFAELLDHAELDAETFTFLSDLTTALLATPAAFGAQSHTCLCAIWKGVFERVLPYLAQEQVSNLIGLSQERLANVFQDVFRKFLAEFQSGDYKAISNACKLVQFKFVPAAEQVNLATSFVSAPPRTRQQAHLSLDPTEIYEIHSCVAFFSPGENHLIAADMEQILRWRSESETLPFISQKEMERILARINASDAEAASVLKEIATPYLARRCSHGLRFGFIAALRRIDASVVAKFIETLSEGERNSLRWMIGRDSDLSSQLGLSRAEDPDSDKKTVFSDFSEAEGESDAEDLSQADGTGEESDADL